MAIPSKISGVNLTDLLGQLLVVVLMFIFKHSSYTRTDPRSALDSDLDSYHLQFVAGGSGISSNTGEPQRGVVADPRSIGRYCMLLGANGSGISVVGLASQPLPTARCGWIQARIKIQRVYRLPDP